MFMLGDISLEKLTLADAPASSAQTILLAESVSTLSDALASSPSGLLLTGADRATRRQIVAVALPSITFVSCNQLGTDLPAEQPSGTPSTCLDDLDSPAAEGFAKGLFTRRVGATTLALAADKRRVPASLLRAGRLEKVVHVVPPSRATREKAWGNILAGLRTIDGSVKGDEEKPRELADWSPGFGVTDFRLVLFNFLARCEGVPAGYAVLKEVVAAHKPVTASGELDFVDASATIAGMDAAGDWGGIGGYCDVKETLIRLCEWPVRHAATFARLGVSPPRGVLLHGPRGCGKTRLALAFLKRLRHANWMHVNAPDVFSKYLGESEARVRALFERARNLAPCVVFIDELDAIGSDRTPGGDAGGTGVERRVLGSLLTELDGVTGGDVFVLACASEIGSIDPALLRPGRLDHLVEVGRPDLHDREEILRELLRNVPVGEPSREGGDEAVKGEVIRRVAAAAAGMTGADLEALCREAAMVTMEQAEDPSFVEVDHFWEGNDRLLKPPSSIAS